MIPIILVRRANTLRDREEALSARRRERKSPSIVQKVQSRRMWNIAILQTTPVRRSSYSPCSSSAICLRFYSLSSPSLCTPSLLTFKLVACLGGTVAQIWCSKVGLGCSPPVMTEEKFTEVAIWSCSRLIWSSCQGGGITENCEIWKDPWAVCCMLNGQSMTPNGLMEKNVLHNL